MYAATVSEGCVNQVGMTAWETNAVAGYEVLAVLSEHPEGRMAAGDLAAALAWETSRLSHARWPMQIGDGR